MNPTKCRGLAIIAKNDSNLGGINHERKKRKEKAIDMKRRITKQSDGWKRKRRKREK